MAEFVGAGGNDTLTGSAEADVLSGLGGNDVLKGGAGDDTIAGGDGNDQLYGDAGRDSLSGGDGSDTLVIDLADRLADGGSGVDVLYFEWMPPNRLLGQLSYSTQALDIDFTSLWSSGVAFIVGVEVRNVERISRFSASNLADRIIFGPGVSGPAFNLDVYLGDGGDYAVGSAFIDRMIGGAGDDTLYGGAGSDNLTGGDGDDTLYGGDDGDSLSGGNGVDKLYGEAGDDFFVASSNDTIDGGAGFDTLRFEKNTTGPAMHVDLRAVWSGGTGVVDGGTVVNIENLGDIHGASNADVLFVGEGVFAWIEYYTSGREPFPGLILRGYAGDDAIIGSSGVDKLYGDAGVDTLSGGNGDDVLNGGQGNDVMDGGEGYDTAEFSGVFADYTWTRQADGSLTVQDRRIEVGDGVDVVRNVEALKFADKSVTLEVSSVIRGSISDDRLEGTSGDDIIDGREGNDSVIYNGAVADFAISWTSDGWRIADQKSGASGNGVDIVRNVENLLFRNGNQFSSLALGDGMSLVVGNILRTTGVWGSDLALSYSYRLMSGALNPAQALVEIVAKAGATTSVATLAYQFFTGKIPGLGGVDYLVSPSGPNANNLNSAYYQNFNLENRYINFAVNLGKLGEGATKFTAEYGGLSLFDATKKAYAAIFGGAPTDAKVTALLSGGRDAYFALYGGDGSNGVGTKAAMVGWLLAEAQKADLGVMVRSNGAWLADLADGSAPFAIDILDPGKGYWKADFVFGGT